MSSPTRSSTPGSPNANNPWPRIDAWLRANAPAVFELLAPPADDEELRELQEAVGHALPASLASAYRAHDGALNDCNTVLGAVRAPKDGLWVRYMSWLSLAAALEQWKLMRGLSDEWPEDDVPVAHDGGGNLVVVSLASGAVTLFDHETWEMTPLADSFAQWMTWLADDMDAGLVVLDEDESEYEDAITLLDKPVKPPPAAAPKPEVDDRASRVFLELLAERKLVQFVRGQDPRPLLKALLPALASKSPEKRMQSVLEVLEASPAVDEVFADDEELAEILEEFG